MLVKSSLLLLSRVSANLPLPEEMVRYERFPGGSVKRQEATRAPSAPRCKGFAAAGHPEGDRIAQAQSLLHDGGAGFGTCSH